MGELEDLARRRIAKWRTEHRVSQERLGNVAQPPLHQTTVGKWEAGDGTVDIDTLAAWARFFGRTLFDLVAHDDATPGLHADFVAAYNALPTDDLRVRVVQMMQAIVQMSGRAAGTSAPPPGPARAAKRAPKRGA